MSTATEPDDSKGGGSPRWRSTEVDDRLGALWRRLPGRVRRAVIDQYARLIGRAVQALRDQARSEER